MSHPRRFAKVAKALGRTGRRARARGAALLLVLWATALLATILVGVAVASRSQGGAALYGSERVRARLAAEAGIAHAVAGLRAADQRERWVPDGRAYTFTFDAAKVTVRVVAVAGLVDVNAAAPGLLRGVFQAAGADAARAGELADAIVAWRGGTARTPQRVGTVPRADPPHGPFRTLEQLARLPGMDASLYATLVPVLTLHSGRNFPDDAYAGPLALAALRGIDIRHASRLVSERRSRPAAQRGVGARIPVAREGAPLVAGHGGTIARVFSSAEMPDGTREGLDTTLRLSLTATRAHPYKVLAWRELALGGVVNDPGNGIRSPTTP